MKKEKLDVALERWAEARAAVRVAQRDLAAAKAHIARLRQEDKAAKGEG